MSELWNDFKTDIGAFTSHITAEEFDYTVNISLKYNYVYVENAKVACSTIKLILQRMELEEPEYRPQNLVDMHTRLFSPLIRPAQTRSFSRYINRPDVYKFCFVRNPYTRVLSAYLDKIKNNMPAKKEILELLGYGGDITRPVTFEEFVRAISKQSAAQMNLHWRVQYFQTFQDQITYDHIGRFESLEDDLKAVLENINPDYEKFWGVESRHGTHSDRYIKDYYSDEIENLVYRIYEKDFEYLGYPRL